MKLKEGLLLREVAGQYVVVPTGENANKIPRVNYMNPTAALLWTHIEDHEFEEEDLVDCLLEHFPQLERQKAEADVKVFVQALKQNGLLQGEDQTGYAYVKVQVPLKKEKEGKN